jgi:hypothetical protein
MQLLVNDEPQGYFVIPMLITENESMFFQLGILRSKSERIALIWLDDVIMKS